MTLTLLTPFDRSYWVVPHKLLAGFYPGDIDLEEAQRKLRALLNAGIRCIVNLTGEDETNAEGKLLVPYTNLLMKIVKERGIDVTYIRAPVKDMRTPSSGTMQMILDTIDSSIQRGYPVYVHCWGGRGRTGTVIGCYLARHGIANGPKALEKIKELRANEATAHKASPETEEQRQMVYRWQQDM